MFDYKLTDLLEGQVGKMRIHKSGKIDVKIGRIKYQIEASQLDTCTEVRIIVQSLYISQKWFCFRKLLPWIQKKIVLAV